jgi:hypothetical protein
MKFSVLWQIFDIVVRVVILIFVIMTGIIGLGLIKEGSTVEGGFLLLFSGFTALNGLKATYLRELNKLKEQLEEGGYINAKEY